MRFAIISDIHGNLPALNAVIKDAQTNHINKYIFVGDYCISNPFPNECIEKIKELNETYAVRGNEEYYLQNLIGKDQRTWTDGQMQISYWCYKNVTPMNRKYLLSLPAKIDIKMNDVSLHITHSSFDFIGDEEHREWRTSKVAQRYGDQFISRDKLKQDIHCYYKNNLKFNNSIDNLSDGIYIFGHSHIQWNYRSDDGKKILINPGSCGLPLDCIENGVPYTILDIIDAENIIIDEKRVPFNKNEYINVIFKSDQYANVKIWSEIIMKEIETNREQMRFFLSFVEEYAKNIGDDVRPYSVSTWEKGYDLWLKSNARL